MVQEDDETILDDITRLDELYQGQVWTNAEVTHNYYFVTYNISLHTILMYESVVELERFYL